jgi:hypothetical protein
MAIFLGMSDSGKPEYRGLLEDLTSQTLIRKYLEMIAIRCTIALFSYYSCFYQIIVKALVFPATNNHFPTFLRRLLFRLKLLTSATPQRHLTNEAGCVAPKNNLVKQGLGDAGAKSCAYSTSLFALRLT